MIFLRSLAVTDHLEQRHTGVPFAGNVSLAPVLQAKADAFRGTIDASVEFLTAEQAAEHLVAVIGRAIACRATLLSRLSDAVSAGRRFVGDLRKLAKEGANPASIESQANVYAAEVAAAIALEATCPEISSAKFTAASLDLIVFDQTKVKAVLSELRDTEAAIEAARARLRESASAIIAAGNEAAERADDLPIVAAVPPSVLTELAALRSEAVAIGARVDTIIGQLRLA